MYPQLEVEYADQTEITNIEAEIAADNSFIDTLGKHIDASTVRLRFFGRGN